MENTSRLPQPLISFDAANIALGSVGGKGINLAKLTQAGFTVPPGFIIPTSSYLDFIESNQLAGQIQSLLTGLDHSSPTDLEAVSTQIRQVFNQGRIPDSLVRALKQGWGFLDDKPLAVRSSATAEDLPDMSFAGQQDTFLNVTMLDQLLSTVIKCWSSLWTARAIGYRHRNNIPDSDVLLAVIVQKMVESETSGVMFTANPLTGLRSEVVIDATFGLGEALVSGQVEPDHYTVDTQTNTVREIVLGAKAISIHGEELGGTSTVEKDRSVVQALPDGDILALAQAGKQIEAHYDFPQDIEWAWKDRQLFILQSRPITSLYPIPDRSKQPFLRTYFSFGAVQGLLTPMTPLGQDAIRLIFSGGASLFGYDHDHQTQQVIWSAGERLWGDITAILRNTIGAKLILRFFPGVEPGSVEALKTLISDPAIEASTGKIRLATFRRIIKFYLSLLRKARTHFRNPEDGAEQIKARYNQELFDLNKRYSLDSPSSVPIEKLPTLFREIRNSFIFAIPEIVPGAMVGLVQMAVLHRFSKKLTGSGNLALELTRGLPNNVTTEMDIKLWEAATAVRVDPQSYQVISSQPPEKLAASYLKEELPVAAQAAISTFLEIYGMRGLGEIDFGRPRWKNDPTPVMQTLQSYLKIEDPDDSPDAVFQRGEENAAEALETLVGLARKTFGGKLKAKVIRGSARRLRALAGLRESPKFYIVQKFGLIKKAFNYHGEQLVRQGVLNHPDDLYFLQLDEFDKFVQGEHVDWRHHITERRNNFNREMLRKQIPRIIVSDGRAFYDGIVSTDADSNQFQGSPVSPGIVVGKARIVLDPYDANLLPGEILVCPGTDPAWTPLFLAAGGLIMEVGGLMTHGAIVAREYGIPAVVGVNSATTILKTGELLSVDGSTGQIQRLEDQ